MKPINTFLLFFSLIASSTWGDNETLKSSIEARLNSLAQPLLLKAAEDHFMDIRLQLVASPLMQTVMIWQPNGERLFPEQHALKHTSDSLALTNEIRLNELKTAAEPSAWMKQDLNGNTLIYCLQTNLSICMLIDSATLSNQLDIKQTDLLQAVFADQIKESTYRSYGFVAFIALVVFSYLGLSHRKNNSSPVETRSPLLLTEDEPSPEVDDCFILGDLNVRPRQLKGHRGDLEIDLTHRDIKILRYLCAHPNEVVTKDELYDAGWGRDFLPSSRALEQHILTLRKKLDPQKNKKALVETVHGQGYRFTS